MKHPTGDVIMHDGRPYDPVKAHDYYLRNRHLKGRRHGSGQAPAPSRARKIPVPQKRQLAAKISALEGKLQKLEKLIKEKEAALKRSQDSSKKPTAADKSKQARESKKFRKKHKTELAAKAKKAAAKKSGGGSKGGKGANGGKPDSEKSIKDLKALATRVRGQLHVAKAKLSAL